MLFRLLLLTLGYCSAYPSNGTQNYTCTKKGAMLVHGNMALKCNGSVYVPEECRLKSSLYVEVEEIKKAMGCHNMLNTMLNECNHECPFKTAKCYCDTISKAYEAPGHQDDTGLFSYTMEKILPIKDRSKESGKHAYHQLAMIIKQETCEAVLNKSHRHRHSSPKYCVLPNHQCFDMAHFHSLRTCNTGTHTRLRGANDQESCENVANMVAKHTNPIAFHAINRTFHFETCPYQNNPAVHHALRFVQPSTTTVAGSAQETSDSSGSEVTHFSLAYNKEHSVVVRNRCAKKSVIRSTLANNQYLKGVLETAGKCGFEEDADECVRKSVESAYKYHHDHLSASLFEKVLGLEACPVKSVGEPQEGHAQRYEQMYQQQSQCQTDAGSEDHGDSQEAVEKCFVEYSTAAGSKMVSVSSKSLNSAFRCNENLARLLNDPAFSTTCRKIKDMYTRHGGASDFEDLFSRMIGAEDVTEDLKREEKYSQHAFEWVQSFVDQSSCDAQAEQSTDEKYECEFEGRLQSNFIGAQTCFKTVNLGNTLACNQKLNGAFAKVCPNNDKDCVCKAMKETYNRHTDDFALSLFHRIFNLEPCTQVEQHASAPGFDHMLDWVRSSVQAEESCTGGKKSSHNQ